MMNQSKQIATKIVPVSLASECLQRIDVYEVLQSLNCFQDEEAQHFTFLSHNLIFKCQIL